ncbi:5801_t:CDS:2, partial [Acaulospora morrowiae]
LFDECTAQYKQSRQLEKKKMREREETWHRLEKTAAHNAQGVPLHYTVGTTSNLSTTNVVETTSYNNFDAEDFTEENQSSEEESTDEVPPHENEGQENDDHGEL